MQGALVLQNGAGARVGWGRLHILRNIGIRIDAHYTAMK